jgi:hypothetical protein
VLTATAAELGQSPTIPTAAIPAGTAAAVQLCSYPTAAVGCHQATTVASRQQLSDEDIPSIDNNIIKNKDATNIVGPVTRKRAKQLEKEIHSQVNANLILINDNISDHSMLPSCCLSILRNDGICARAWDKDGFNPPTVW